MDEEEKVYKQNWQVCVVSDSNLVIKIEEFQLQWRDDITATTDEEIETENYVKLIGRILIVLNEPLNIRNKINFLPYYPNPETMLIGGTQIVPEEGSKSYHHFILDNLGEADI